MRKDISDALWEFANAPGNLKYRYAVVFPKPLGFDMTAVENYTNAQDVTENMEKQTYEIVNLLDYWRG